MKNNLGDSSVGNGIARELTAFVIESGFLGKGQLSLALVVTQHAKTMGFPLDAQLARHAPVCRFSQPAVRSGSS